MSSALTPDLVALGRRAVACKGWRWMPGMLTIPSGEDEDEEPLRVLCKAWRAIRYRQERPWTYAETEAEALVAALEAAP